MKAFNRGTFMKNKELENQIEFLLTAALKKCGNSYDAEDLTQETLLAALIYMTKGNDIQDLRAWLLTVMNRKYNDMLRRKYRQPTIGIGDDFDIACDDDRLCELEKVEEAEQVRKAIAYLARIYREVLVRYYMNGQSISEIASDLGVPVGTVKSRLYSGRNQIKKGLNSMEKYTKQSYSPITLHISNSGCSGRNGEPSSLVYRDLLAQNILWLAYPRPVTIEKLSSAIGVPTAYVEPVIQKLIDGELMKKVGNEVYTDFMISTVEDKERYIPDQKQLVSEHFDLFWKAIDRGLNKIRSATYYGRHGFDARNSLEMYFAFHCLDYGLYRTFNDIFKANQIFPDRPNGGRWIAFGTVYFKPFHPMEHTDLMAHSYSGERILSIDGFAGNEVVEMHVYGADGFPDYRYDCSPDYTFFAENENLDAVFTKLLYILHSGVNPESVGFNPEYLKAIPWLTKCKILRTENGKPFLNIPILTKEEVNGLWNICTEAIFSMVEDLRELLTRFFDGKNQKIPAHLKGIPLQKQYFYAYNAMLFATIREAMKRGNLYDGHYDDDSNGVNQHPCPMIIIF